MYEHLCTRIALSPFLGAFCAFVWNAGVIANCLLKHGVSCATLDAMSKTRKQPYRKSRRFDATCRCHGRSLRSRGNRTYNDRRRRAAADAQLRELAGITWR